MREIKFRALDKKTNHMTDHDWLTAANVVYGALFRKRDDIIVMQFTGFKDKNENEIYEGDIINGNDAYGVHKGSITWWNDRWCMTYQGPKDGTPQFQSLMTVNGTREVIGNIHQNPELL